MDTSGKHCVATATSDGKLERPKNGPSLRKRGEGARGSKEGGRGGRATFAQTAPTGCYLHITALVISPRARLEKCAVATEQRQKGGIGGEEGAESLLANERVQRAVRPVIGRGDAHLGDFLGNLDKEWQKG